MPEENQVSRTSGSRRRVTKMVPGSSAKTWASSSGSPSKRTMTRRPDPRAVPGLGILADGVLRRRRRRRGTSGRAPWKTPRSPGSGRGAVQHPGRSSHRRSRRTRPGLAPPPELARDAPGLDVLQPVVVGLLLALGQDAGAAVADRLEGRPGELRSVDVPLVGQERLDRNLGTVAVWDGVDPPPSMPSSQPWVLGERHDQFARLVAVETVEVAPRPLPSAGCLRLSPPKAALSSLSAASGRGCP